MIRCLSALFFCLLAGACSSPSDTPQASEKLTSDLEDEVLSVEESEPITLPEAAVEVKVLGLAQDAGYPQINCKKACCAAYWQGERVKESPTCLGIIDRVNKKMWMIEATPDIVAQWQLLQENCPDCEMSGILITHAHMGHYTGLMQLGREAMGAQGVPVYVMPKMMQYLSSNGPWSQLVNLGNIELKPLHNDSNTQLSSTVSVNPFLVPHRDEYSETVGFSIQGPKLRALFVPDIDKWHKWETSITSLVKEHDWAFLDGTFYDGTELPGRDMSEIPHPFIQESMATFESLSLSEKGRIHFIHFNHTNPLLDTESSQAAELQKAGFSVASLTDFYGL